MEETLQRILQELQQLKHGQTRLEDRIGGVENKVGSLDVRMGGLEDKVGSLDIRMGGLEDKVGSLDARMGSLESKVDRLDAELGGLKSEVKEIKQLSIASFQQLGTLTEFRTEMSLFRAETNQRLEKMELGMERHSQLIERLAVRSLEQETEISALRYVLR